MLQNPKVIRPSANSFPPSLRPPLPPPQQFQIAPNTQSPSAIRYSRRDISIFANSSVLLFLASQSQDLFHLSNAIAEETTTPTKPNACPDKAVTKKVFLEVAVDGVPIGRIVMGLYGDTSPVGSSRFANLVSGSAGVSYRRKEFAKIMPNYVQHSGVRSYGVDAELAKNTGSELAADRLVRELDEVNGSCAGTKNVVGSVSIVVRDPLRPPPKIKVVARNGKLEIDEEEVGSAPNGTEFIITTKESPELDASALVVGRVLEGIEVAKRIGQVQTVQENTSSPYFRVAKLIGDKRAVVAERGFNRPYSKVVITNCGILPDM